MSREPQAKETAQVGAVLEDFFTWARMKGAYGEFAIEGLRVEPMLGMNEEAGSASAALKETLCHVFIGDHSSGSS